MDVWALAGDFLTTCFFRPGTLLLCLGAVAAWLLFKAIRKYKWGLLYNFIAGVMVVVCHIDVLLELAFLVLLLPFPYLGRFLKKSCLYVLLLGLKSCACFLSGCTVLCQWVAQKL